MIKRPRILQLISSLETGGAEKLLVNFLKTSALENHAEHFVVIMNDNIHKGLYAELMETGYPVFCMGRKRSHAHPRYLFCLLKIILKNRINMIHTHNNGSTFWGMICKMVFPYLKLVYTVHACGIIPAMKPQIKLLHRVVIDMHIAISSAVEAECLENGLKKTKKIYNGINIEAFKPGAAREKGLVPPLKMIHVARINHLIKGQDILLKALDLCKKEGLDFNCQFVGSYSYYGQESYRYLQTLVKDFQLENHVQFLGDRSDIPDLLNQAHLFILPSRIEGFGLVILEAMAAGLPVIVSRIDGPKELVYDGINGYHFENENFVELSQKIRNIAFDYQKATQLADYAFNHINTFDISNMYKEYVKLYQKLTQS